MLSDELIDKLTERLVERITEGNTYVLKKIAENLVKFKTLTLTDAKKLAQILKYGGSYEKIIFKLAQITNLNEKEIKQIFEEVAKSNVNFAKQFYEFRGIDAIPYSENYLLQKEITAIANRAIQEYRNISRTSGIGVVMQDKFGNKQFTLLRKAYDEYIDEAVISISEGKDTFDSQMYKIINELGGSGLKVEYESGLTRRLDSAVRMNLKESLRTMSNDMQEQFAKDFKANGVEVSAHPNPAEDHELLQGRQYSNKEFEKLQNKETAISYDKVKILANKNRRKVSTLNCQHYYYSIILGVSKPEYSKEQLQEMIDKNHEGFEYEGKQYTLYEGTQLQRKLETKIREWKDKQIMARELGNKKGILEAQTKISQLTAKYNELSEISGLPTRAKRMRVSGYRRVKI